MKLSTEIKDTFWLSVIQGVGMVLPLFIYPYLMVALGAENFGVFSFTLSVVQFLVIITDFGFNWTSTKQIAQNQGNQVEIDLVFTNTVIAKIILFVVALGVLLFLASIPRFEIYRNALLISSVMLLAHTFTFTWLFQGIGKVKVVSLITVAVKVLILPTVFFVVKNGNDLYALMFVYAVYSLLPSLIIWAVIKRNRVARFVTTSVSGVKHTFREGVLLFFSNLVVSFYTSVLTIILGYYAAPSEVGKYATVEKVMRVATSSVHGPFVTAYFPTVSRLAKGDRVQAQKIIWKVVSIVSAIMLALFLLLFFGSDYVLQFLGKDYEGTQDLFRILAIVPLFIGCSCVFGRLGLLGSGGAKQKKQFTMVHYVISPLALAALLFFNYQLNAIIAGKILFFTELSIFLSLSFFYFKFIRDSKSEKLTEKNS